MVRENESMTEGVADAPHQAQSDSRAAGRQLPAWWNQSASRQQREEEARRNLAVAEDELMGGVYDTYSRSS